MASIPYFLGSSHVSRQTRRWRRVAGAPLQQRREWQEPSCHQSSNQGRPAVFYSVAAVFGTRFTAFHANESARDKSQAAVYWKADNDGFNISYDITTWNSQQVGNPNGFIIYYFSLQFYKNCVI